MPRPSFRSVDDYIAAQPAPARPVLERVRGVIRRALPSAAEGISYQIPVYRLDGANVLFFAGFPRHCSIYPATDRVLEALGDELAGLLHGKATIRLSLDAAVPSRLIARVAKVRAAEVAEPKPKPARPGRARPDAARAKPRRRARAR